MLGKKILVPIDGSNFGNVAIDYGIYIAHKLNAQLMGLHVIDARFLPTSLYSDISGSIGLPPYQDMLPILESSLVEKADSLLAAFSEKCKKACIQSEIKKAVGIIDKTIIEESKETELILLAQRGDHFHLAGGAILGSTAESVVRKAGKPVMVVPGHFMEIESMGLAYDGSVPANHALSLATALSYNASWPLTTIIVTKDYQYAATLAKNVEDFIETLQNEKEIIINNETIILSGSESKEIIRFIHDGSIELMVMGAYGHNRLREIFLGSTTSSVIRKTTIPVLLTR
jgi:nucleotide-binding universal stress UspA family protein